MGFKKTISIENVHDNMILHKTMPVYLLLFCGFQKFAVENRFISFTINDAMVSKKTCGQEK